jgi:hypothetical protein
VAAAETVAETAAVVETVAVTEVEVTVRVCKGWQLWLFGAGLLTLPSAPASKRCSCSCACWAPSWS